MGCYWWRSTGKFLFLPVEREEYANAYYVNELGGLAIGLTSGLLAAPVIISSLFGVAGGGLAGYRVRQRWAGVQDFDFVQIVGGDESGEHGAPKEKVAIEKDQAPSLVVSLITLVTYREDTEPRGWFTGGHRHPWDLI